MSYSFTVSEATKDAAISKADDELKAVVAAQPFYQPARTAIFDAITKHVGLLGDNAPVNVSVGGSHIEDGSGNVTAASVSVFVSLV